VSTVKSLSVGNGDMFYIEHNSDNFTIVDCSMPDDQRDDIIDEVVRESAGKNLVRFISTHPDQDHLCGFSDLHARMNFKNFYCVRNQATKGDGATKDFLKYCELRDDPKKVFYIEKGSRRKWMNRKDDDRDSAGISILWPVPSNANFQAALEDAHEGHCPNNISTILRYSVQGGAAFLWMGDLDTGFMDDIEYDITLTPTDILFAPHHGRDTGRVPSSWLDEIRPRLIVVGEAPSEHLHYYPNYNTITQNSAGDITFECETGKTHIFVSSPTYEVDFLEDEGLEHGLGKYYIGTLVSG
jgi:beta-lactamase superfamily II metal-dependent hydrolase